MKNIKTTIINRGVKAVLQNAIIKGKQGEQGMQGPQGEVDYNLVNQEIQRLVDEFISTINLEKLRGKDGFDGINGIDGMDAEFDYDFAREELRNLFKDFSSTILTPTNPIKTKPNTVKIDEVKINKEIKRIFNSWKKDLKTLKGDKGERGERGAYGPQGQIGPEGRPGLGLIQGGTTGQVLAKKTDTDYDTEWIDSAGGGGGATNLTYTASPTQGQVNSNTGTDAVLPATDVTNAGLFLPAEKTKLAGIATGAEVNVNADWNSVSGDSQILNKPTIITNHTALSNIGTNTHEQIDTHIGSISNPHSVTKTQVGLGNVDNTSDSAKNSATTTLTNKRITPRTGTTTSSATPTINTDNVDFYSITAQAVDIASFTTNLSGTPTDGQKLWIAIQGTAARAITWGASFEASTVALPITTVTTARLDVGFVWNAATSKWRVVAVA